MFRHVKGVTSATSGYAGGSVASPTYDQVGTGATGHAESVRVTYDPARVSYEQLLEVFFTVAHDPTQLNRQGPDHGTQYRSIVFYSDTVQRREVKAFVAELTNKKRFAKPIVTEIVPLTVFIQGGYHQNYMARNRRPARVQRCAEGREPPAPPALYGSRRRVAARPPSAALLLFLRRGSRLRG